MLCDTCLGVHKGRAIPRVVKRSSQPAASETLCAWSRRCTVDGWRRRPPAVAGRMGAPSRGAPRRRMSHVGQKKTTGAGGRCLKEPGEKGRCTAAVQPLPGRGTRASGRQTAACAWQRARWVLAGERGAEEERERGGGSMQWPVATIVQTNAEIYHGAESSPFTAAGFTAARTLALSCDRRRCVSVRSRGGARERKEGEEGGRGLCLGEAQPTS